MDHGSVVGHLKWVTWAFQQQLPASTTRLRLLISSFSRDGHKSRPKPDHPISQGRAGAEHSVRNYEAEQGSDCAAAHLSLFRERT